tara:strand:- start:66 stop:332 length:267 start_codon:yes stop_codon:yes gene_type:complete
MRLVKVVWLDTNEVSDGTWQSKEELLKSKPCSIDSLGYLVEETQDYVIISADKDSYNQDDLFGRSQVIPKGVIQEIIEYNEPMEPVKI